MKRLLRLRRLMRPPLFARLSLRLVRDARVPTVSKAMAIGALALVLSPLDLPGWMPVLGQGLDAALIAAILEGFTRAAPAQVVRAHEAALGAA